MKLVIDANILFSFFKKESFTRRFILSNPEIELFTSLFVFEELDKHKKEIKVKSKIDDKVYRLIRNELKDYVTILPLEKFKEYWVEAKQISPDYDDTEYFAVALALGCAIWSNDKKLKSQSRVMVFSTKELIKLV